MITTAPPLTVPVLRYLSITQLENSYCIVMSFPAICYTNMETLFFMRFLGYTMDKFWKFRYSNNAEFYMSPETRTRWT